MRDEMTSDGLIDFVKCMNCGFQGEVKGGEEQCPKCKMIGCLAWSDDCK